MAITYVELAERQEKKGRLIRQIREENGYTRATLSKMLGIAPSTLQKVENGEAGTEDKKFWIFLDIFGLTEAEFAHRLEADDGRKISEEEARIDRELRAVLKHMSLHVKRILHFIFCRDWGGDVERLMDIVACHISLSLMQRLRHSEQYVSEYRLNADLKLLRNEGLEPPDIDRLDAVNREEARAALLSGKDGY